MLLNRELKTEIEICRQTAKRKDPLPKQEKFI